MTVQAGMTIEACILPRTSAGRFMRLCRSVLVLARLAGACRLGPWHRRCYFPLFLWRQLEDVIGEQLAMIARITLERWRRRPSEDPLIVLLLEQAGRHRCSGAHCLRISNPALDPIRFQAFFREQEVWRCGEIG